MCNVSSPQRLQRVGYVYVYVGVLASSGVNTGDSDRLP